MHPRAGRGGGDGRASVLSVIVAPLPSAPLIVPEMLQEPLVPPLAEAKVAIKASQAPLVCVNVAAIGPAVD